ncbi:MAG: hypothetical protein WBO23_04310 [Burkholderiales bacterium]
MPTDTAISDARDLTLQKIGRNVVNFQKMEAMLKFILKVANFAAPISKGLEHFETQAKLHRTKPMGHLVDLAAKALHGEAPSVPKDAREVWVTHSVSLSDGSQLKEWRKEFRRIVRERNSLIHRRLATWNPGSIESCRSLCEELDAQRERIRPAYEHLESVVKVIRETHEELARNVDAIVANALSARAHGA